MNKNKLFEEELINAVDLEAAPPTEEPERQYYYIAKARKYVKELSEKLGRPLFAHVTTFGWRIYDICTWRTDSTVCAMGSAVLYRSYFCNYLGIHRIWNCED